MHEELISSNSIDTLVSFVGVREYLVYEFLRPYVENKNNNLKKIFLFSSVKQENEDPYIHSKSMEIMEKIVKQIIVLRPDVEIEEIFLENIWDIKYCLGKLSAIDSKVASVNITAGPSTFSVASLLWAIENNYFIEHSVETVNKLIGKIVVFQRINIIPYFKSIFEIDNVDREIIAFLKRGATTTNKLRLHLKEEKRMEMTLRTIESRVSKLNEMGIIKISKGRVNIIELGNDYKLLS